MEGCGERVVFMKIISFNIKGLGALEKRREIHRLVSERKLTVLCYKNRSWRW